MRDEEGGKVVEGGNLNGSERSEMGGRGMNKEIYK